MRRLSWILAVALSVVLIGGCNAERLKETVLTPWDKWIKTPLSLPEDTIDIPQDQGAKLPPDSGESIPVAIYYLKDGILCKEIREIPKVPGIARRTLQEMLENPAPSGFKSAFPQGVHLNDINLKPDGTCIVDLGSEVLKLKGSSKKVAITALTRTLGQYPTIKRVVILVNGEEIPDWVGPWQVGQN